MNPVDGGWGEWTGFEECSATCGRGRRHRYRECDRPITSEGGKPCLLTNGGGRRGGRDIETEECNLRSCDEKKDEDDEEVVVYSFHVTSCTE